MDGEINWEMDLTTPPSLDPTESGEKTNKGLWWNNSCHSSLYVQYILYVLQYIWVSNA